VVAVDPLAWMTDVLTKLVNLWPVSRISELMPWTYAKQVDVGRLYRFPSIA
jgi:IS66 C-terminal element